MGTERQSWTPKQRLFFKYYVGAANLNATEAARRAGYKEPNKYGPYLVNLGKIRAKIDEWLEQNAMPSTEVVDRLGAQAAGSLINLIRPDGTLDPEQWKQHGHLIESIEFDSVTNDDGTIRRVVRRIKLYSSQAALMHLDRHHGGPKGGPIPDVSEVNVNDLRESILGRLAGYGEREQAAGDHTIP